MKFLTQYSEKHSEGYCLLRLILQNSPLYSLKLLVNKQKNNLIEISF